MHKINEQGDVTHLDLGRRALLRDGCFCLHHFGRVNVVIAHQLIKARLASVSRVSTELDGHPQELPGLLLLKSGQDKIRKLSKQNALSQKIYGVMNYQNGFNDEEPSCFSKKMINRIVKLQSTDKLQLAAPPEKPMNAEEFYELLAIEAFARGISALDYSANYVRQFGIPSFVDMKEEL